MGVAAGIHIHSMITEHNFELGNAGVIFWTDIVIPVIGFILLWLQRRYEMEGTGALALALPKIGSRSVMVVTWAH